MILDSGLLFWATLYYEFVYCIITKDSKKSWNN